MKITEGIQFAEFDSIGMDFYLLERDMPSPTPKEAKEDIPYSQGAIDYSMITGERHFRERTGRYVFRSFNKDYETRKSLEQAVKRRVMLSGQTQLYDTHDIGYYWLGTCQSVDVYDDHEYNALEVVMIFSLYPFMLSASQSYSDLYQDIQPEAYVPTDYIVDGELTIEILNYGDTAVSPVIITERS